MTLEMQKRGDGRSGEETRTTLMSVALELFAAKGYEATSTREIASAAKANIASIAYHFGGKEGLHTACATFVAERLTDAIGRAVLEAKLPDDPAVAALLVEQVAGSFVAFLIGQPQAKQVAGFIIREINRPGPIFERLYLDVFEPVHRRLCALLAIATGCDAESDTIRIGAFSLAGQIIYFRLGFPIVARRMDWHEPGPAEVEKLATVVRANIRAFIETNARKEPR